MAENKAEQLRVQEKLAKAKARSQVYEERENTCTEMIRNDQRERYGCSGTSIKQEQVNTEGRSKTKSSDVSPDLSKMMCGLLRHQSAPEVEIETFRGDPLVYH